MTASGACVTITTAEIFSCCFSFQTGTLPAPCNKNSILPLHGVFVCDIIVLRNRRAAVTGAAVPWFIFILPERAVPVRLPGTVLLFCAYLPGKGLHVIGQEITRRTRSRGRAWPCVALAASQQPVNTFNALYALEALEQLLRTVRAPGRTGPRRSLCQGAARQARRK